MERNLRETIRILDPDQNIIAGYQETKTTEIYTTRHSKHRQEKSIRHTSIIEVGGN